MAVAALQWSFKSLKFSLYQCQTMPSSRRCRRHAFPSCVRFRSGGWSSCWCFAKFETSWKNKVWLDQVSVQNWSIYSINRCVCCDRAQCVHSAPSQREAAAKFQNWKAVWSVQVTSTSYGPVVVTYLKTVFGQFNHSFFWLLHVVFVFPCFAAQSIL